MSTTQDDRRNSHPHPLTTAVGAVATLIGVAAVAAVAAGLFRTGLQDRTKASSVGGAGPVAATVLHVRGARGEAGGHTTALTTVEAWLDETTNGGKIVETGPDGAVRRAVSFSGDTHVLYLGDARHAVVRHGLGPNSPAATSIRDELLRYQVSVQRGVGQVVGNGRVGERATNQVQIEIDGNPVLADVDQATGLALREDTTQPGGTRQIRETTYSTVERVSRSSLPADVLQLNLPPGTSREEYTEDPVGHADPGTTGLPYAVYAAPASAGAPVAVFRRTSTAPNGLSSDVYYLIYRTPDGEVQVLSGLRPDTPAGQGKKDPMDGNRSPMIQIAGISWEVATSSREVQGKADLGDAFVTIYAPNQATFERIAASLVRYDRR